MARFEMSGGSSFRRGHVVASLAGLALFALLAALVAARALSGTDLAAARAIHGYHLGFFDAWSTVTAILISAELSVLYALGGCLLLWRAGLGRWSVAPMGFLLPSLLEIGMKLTLRQPPLPEEYVRHTYYPLTSLSLLGTFPSGHALRSAFLCTFLGVLLWRRGDAGSRLASLAFFPLALLLGFARIYLGQHWISDVVAGLILGGSVALLAASPVAQRLFNRTRE